MAITPAHVLISNAKGRYSAKPTIITNIENSHWVAPKP